ncbi:hypothetical protein NKW43_15335, partial [Gluconobacter albidus]|nr:hypothetical protein [Gluconobacter albidus]
APDLLKTQIKSYPKNRQSNRQKPDITGQVYQPRVLRSLQMIHAIMQQMAALAQRPKIAHPVDRGVVVQMRSGQNHLGLSGLKQSDEIRRRDGVSPFIEPVPRLWMLPPTTRKDLQDLSMGSTTLLAYSSGLLEPHLSAQLSPVRRIKRFQFRSDRHSCLLTQNKA